MNRPDHCPLSADRVRALLLSAPELLLHMSAPPVTLSFSLPLSSGLLQPSFFLSLSFFLPSYASFSLVILHFLRFSHPLPPSICTPPGSQGEAKRPGPAEGAEPAERGGPQGARRRPGPPGPARGGAPPQGRGALREPPALLVTGAGCAGGTWGEVGVDTA